MSLAIRGALLLRSGRSEPAVPSLELPLRLDPRPVVWWPVTLSQAYYFTERYDDAIRLLDRFEPAFKEDPLGYAVLAAAHGQLGRLDEAARAGAARKRLSPFLDGQA